MIMLAELSTKVLTQSLQDKQTMINAMQRKDFEPFLTNADIKQSTITEQALTIQR
jgi:hypothetical protein